MSLDQRAQAQAFVQLAREQEPSIGGHRGSSELDAQLRIEREVNRARCRVTHRVVPSASARSRREPRFLRVLGDYGQVRSPLKTKMWGKTSSCLLWLRNSGMEWTRARLGHNPESRVGPREFRARRCSGIPGLRESSLQPRAKRERRWTQRRGGSPSHFGPTGWPSHAHRGEPADPAAHRRQRHGRRR